jgi:hypothetical protein
VYSLLLAFQPDVAECVCCAAGPKLLIQARLARLKGDIATAKKDNSLAVKFVRCAQPAGASCRVWSRSSTGAIATGAAPRRAHPCNICAGPNRVQAASVFKQHAHMDALHDRADHLESESDALIAQQSAGR